jgi:type IX secretion system PorP/SprF family membrane protein
MKTIFNTIQYLFRMNNCAKWMFVGLIILVGNTVKAQQEPMYTQYMFNTQTINPAYAGTWESTGFMVLAREQWVGFDNAPSTQTFTFQTLNKNKNVGLGLSVIHDKFGLEKRLAIYGDYSYLVRFNNDVKLRLGLKGGFSNYSNNLNEYIVVDGNDPQFQGEIDQKFLPNFGVGAFLYKDNYYLGMSVPKIVQTSFENNYNNYSTKAEVRHFYFMGGYVFDLSDNLQFKPTILSKVTSGAPAQFDFSANFLIAEKVWLGAMYRTGDSFGFLAQWVIDKKLRLGYAVDFTTTKLQKYHDGTHEIMISYELKLQKSGSPRYF